MFSSSEPVAARSDCSAKVHYKSNSELAQLIHFKSQVSSFEAFDFWHVADTAHCPEVPLWHKSP